MDKKLSKIYYSPQGYWRGYRAINHLAEAAGVSKERAKTFLEKQGMWQIYLAAPKYIPRPRFDVTRPNEIHQADLLFLPYDRPGRGRKLYKYALTIVDIASRYKEAEPLATKTAREVAMALEKIYKRSPLDWPKLLQVDPGKEFMGSVNELLEKHGTKIRRGRVDIHRDQAIVERFNQTLAERLFGHQYAQEMLLDGKRSVEWVKRLPAVVAAVNNEVTRITANKPSEAIKLDSIIPKPPHYNRPVGFDEERLSSNINVRYLYYDGELEGGNKRRATDPIWSLDVYKLARLVVKSNTPIVYYLIDGPHRGFVREELLVVPPDTQQPPSRLV